VGLAIFDASVTADLLAADEVHLAVARERLTNGDAVFARPTT
jgi:hypothetical protein